LKNEANAIDDLKMWTPRNWRAIIGKAIKRYSIDTKKKKRFPQLKNHQQGRDMLINYIRINAFIKSTYNSAYTNVMIIRLKEIPQNKKAQKQFVFNLSLCTLPGSNRRPAD
jgi:hypothetical protein